MTWFDHETESIWSQPWGRALSGPLKGTELALLASQITTWGNWKETYPDTLAMATGANRLSINRERFTSDFVIGLVLAEAAQAFNFEDVDNAGVINTYLGDFPVAVWAEEKEFRAYVRQVGEQELTLTVLESQVVDEETGSTWDILRGLATEGPLAGQALQAVPSMSAFDWAWLDFYPNSEIFEPD